MIREVFGCGIDFFSGIGLAEFLPIFRGVGEVRHSGASRHAMNPESSCDMRCSMITWIPGLASRSRNDGATFVSERSNPWSVPIVIPWHCAAMNPESSRDGPLEIG